MQRFTGPDQLGGQAARREVHAARLRWRDVRRVSAECGAIVWVVQMQHPPVRAAGDERGRHGGGVFDRGNDRDSVRVGGGEEVVQHVVLVHRGRMVERATGGIETVDHQHDARGRRRGVAGSSAQPVQQTRHPFALADADDRSAPRVLGETIELVGAVGVEHVDVVGSGGQCVCRQRAQRGGCSAAGAARDQQVALVAVAV
ncbi:unannotated protein [freshwater metagenome]|uniref:Unannotated protein n=1 Tax=freshwater metagenome TaxID=449393 RepID=A0A6J7L1A9_9ZZZZ